MTHLPHGEYTNLGQNSMTNLVKIPKPVLLPELTQGFPKVAWIAPHRQKETRMAKKTRIVRVFFRLWGYFGNALGIDPNAIDLTPR